MATTTRTERVTVPDGGNLGAHLVLPEARHGPGLLLIHEIFGVNDYIRRRAEALARLGYVVLCPDVFWRLRPGLDIPHDEAGLNVALGIVQQYDFVAGLSDLGVALEHLRSLPEVQAAGGRAGAMGFCLGGTLAWQVASHLDPDTAVAYYGSGIRPGSAADLPSCPVLLHFGDDDAYIPREQVEQILAVVADRPDIEVRRYRGAGHAFDNEAAMFHDPAARAEAWPVTVDFLARTLPVDD